MAKKANSLAHTKWMCKYHIVFTPKYRRKAIYNQYREDLGEILRRLCRYRGVEIIEEHLMIDHVHMLVMIPPKESISSFMGYLKGKSAMMMFDRHANLKYQYGNRHFWAEGYYVSTVGLNDQTVAKYIREQEAYDIAMDKLSVKEYKDPFEEKEIKKEKKKKGIRGDRLKDKNIALIFEKPSTRTRCAFTVGARDEGGMPTYLSGHEIQLGDKESIADTARVLGRMFDGIEFRGFEHEYIIELAKYSGVPVWNGLTDDYHPTQCLAMLLTLREHFDHLKGLKIAYMGDGRNNTVNSLIIGSIKVGIDVTVVGPKTLWTKPEIVELVKEYGEESGAKLTLTEDLDGVIGADVIYTDVWFSMGEEKKEQERERLCRKYQVNKALMERTGKPGTIFSHCLPAVKEKEVTEEVFESEASVVFDEAENRLHTIKAIMVATLGN